MIENLAFNIVAIIISLVSMLAYNYHAYYYSLQSIFMIQSSDAKIKSQLARNWSAASMWMKKHAEKDDAPSVTLAVQTFRNTILVSTFVGSITFQAAISTIGSYPLSGDEIDKTRIIILGVLLFLSFLSWASAIRCAAYLGYQTGVLSINTSNTNDHHIIRKSPNKDTNIKKQNILEISNHPSTNANTANKEFVSNNLGQQQQPTHLPKSSSTSALEEGICDSDVLSPPAVAPVKQPSSKEQIQEQLPLSRTESGVYHMHNHEAHMMIIMLLSFSLGFRFLFLAIPFFLYIAGPISLIIFTFFMLIFLYLWDHLFTLDDMSQQPLHQQQSSSSAQFPLVPQYNNTKKE